MQCLLEMLIAGTDTSSISMFYTLLGLAEHVGVQQKAHDEIHDALGMAASGWWDLGGFAEGVCDELPYLVGCINEGMRLKPVGPVIMRRATGPVHLHEGLELAAGSNVIINNVAMHVDPSLFDRPKQFDPSRWLNSVSHVHGKH